MDKNRRSDIGQHRPLCPAHRCRPAPLTYLTNHRDRRLVHGETAEADHLRATVTLNRLQPRRSLVLWLTDPAETSMQPEVAEGAAQLMRRHLVLFVAIEQRDLRKIASMRPENQQQMFAGAAAQEMVHWRELLLARLRQRGALTLETYPEEMTSLVLNRYLEIKEKALL